MPSLCIHAHFYQPARENPWTGEVEPQPSAAPDHDWNARITRECYAPLAESGALERMSFNFGPTLLAWMERCAPGTYARILRADAAGAQQHAGHGPAIAQAWGHAILPLCNEHDRRTQVLWGVRDFQRRFGRAPRGLWLPETAVDTPTLEALAGAGVAFTVLARHQARQVRRAGESAWSNAGERLDRRRAYRCALPSGRSVTLFFYDGELARGVAFGDLLSSGERLAAALLAAGRDGGEGELVHLAVDGETFGHHRRGGDAALAAALRGLAGEPRVRLTNYDRFLAEHPPADEARIAEGTSWSCPHGLERWRSDCGCRSGPAPSHQRWRTPLRAALEWLRDAAAIACEQAGAGLLRDFWAARDEALDLLEGPAALAGAFLGRHAPRPLNDAEADAVRLLMELQRQSLLMFTSCGWFHDDVAGLEAAQVLRHAGRVADLAHRGLGVDLRPELVRRLAEAPGNTRQFPDAAAVFRRHALPAGDGQVGPAPRTLRA